MKFKQKQKIQFKIYPQLNIVLRINHCKILKYNNIIIIVIFLHLQAYQLLVANNFISKNKKNNYKVVIKLKNPKSINNKSKINKDYCLLC